MNVFTGVNVFTSVILFLFAADINSIYLECNDIDHEEECLVETLASTLTLSQLLELNSYLPQVTALPQHQRRSLLSMEDPGQAMTTVRSHASNYHETIVGGADIDKEQPLYQPSLEGYYPAFGYETATPQCKRILNRYLGKCMMKSGDGGGERFQQVVLSQQNARNDNTGKLLNNNNNNIQIHKVHNNNNYYRGEDETFIKDLNFAQSIITCFVIS